MNSLIHNMMPQFWIQNFSGAPGVTSGVDVFVLDPTTVPGPLYTRFLAADISNLASAMSNVQSRIVSLEGSGSGAPSVDVDLSFTVSSSAANGYGVSSFTSNGYVSNVYMNTVSIPTGTPAFGTSRAYAVLAASTITNSGSSVINGNVGLYPGTSVTGFPPGTISGTENLTNAAAQAAVASALASYNDLSTRTAGPSHTTLDGLTLAPGTYTSATSMALAGTAPLTLNGAGVYIFQMATTLVTGATGAPTMILENGARAEDIYWVVGSSATLNQGTAATFYGNILAHASITMTLGGTVYGSLVALTGAITISAASTINAVALAPSSIGAGSPNPMPGYAVIQFNTNFNHYLGGSSTITSPGSSTQLAVTGAAAALVVGQVYVITAVGTTSTSQWQALGLSSGLTPAVGQSFVAIATGSGSGTGMVQGTSVSGVQSVEVIGNPNATLSNTGGSYLLVQFLSNGVATAPADGTTVNMTFDFN